MEERLYAVAASHTDQGIELIICNLGRGKVRKWEDQVARIINSSSSSSSSMEERGTGLLYFLGPSLGLLIINCDLRSVAFIRNDRLTKFRELVPGIRWPSPHLHTGGQRTLLQSKTCAAKFVTGSFGEQVAGLLHL